MDPTQAFGLGYEFSAFSRNLVAAVRPRRVLCASVFSVVK
jgi:hypothetical protein